MERKKIIIFEQHFAYISNELYELFMQKSKVKDMTDFIKNEAYKDFDIVLKDFKDLKKLKELIKENQSYNSPADWLRDKIRDHLQLGVYKKYIDDMVCLADVKTENDIKKYKKRGYNTQITAQDFHQKYPLLDVNKVFYDNTILKNMVYYDSARYAMVELYWGYNPNKENKPENYELFNPAINMGVEEGILKKIDFIYESFKEGNYEYFTYLNFPFYRNEILDIIISNSTDEKMIKQLRNCQNIE